MSGHVNDSLEQSADKNPSLSWIPSTVNLVLAVLAAVSIFLLALGYVLLMPLSMSGVSPQPPYTFKLLIAAGIEANVYHSEHGTFPNEPAVVARMRDRHAESRVDRSSPEQVELVTREMVLGPDLVDYWGSDLRFDFSRGSILVIRSAGPNLTFHDGDDIWVEVDGKSLLCSSGAYCPVTPPSWRLPVHWK